MTLRDGKMGESYRVQGLNLPRAARIRLEALGMTGGTSVLIMNKKRSGSMVIKVRGTRFAVGSSIAQSITVDERQDG